MFVSRHSRQPSFFQLSITSQTESMGLVRLYMSTAPTFAVLHNQHTTVCRSRCNTYLPHCLDLKSFIFVVATVLPMISSPPIAVTSPPALSSTKNVRLLTLWNFT